MCILYTVKSVLPGARRQSPIADSVTNDLSKLALLIALYGGPGLVALLIVLGGAIAAQRKSSVIAIASIAGICVLLQAVLLFFLSDMGRAWSGGGGKDSILVTGGGVIALLAALAIPLFVRRKLATTESADPADTVRAAALATVVFLLFYVTSSLMQAGSFIEPSALPRPRFWLVTLVAVAAAWGLWRHARWAWWLGVAGPAWELFHLAQRLVLSPASAASMLLSRAGLMALLQVVVVALLLHKNSRLACLR